MKSGASRKLDERFRKAGPIKRGLVRPPHGWIKAIRQALGMSAAQMGRRLGISQPSVAALERSEELNRIQLDSLQRAAAALNCSLVYALVPNDSLEAMVKKRARAVAAKHLREVERSMALEDQAVSDPEERERQLEELADEVDKRMLWEES
jgi:predicted DNA-binding mobile mystery protein A